MALSFREPPHLIDQPKVAHIATALLKKCIDLAVVVGLYTSGVTPFYISTGVTLLVTFFRRPEMVRMAQQPQAPMTRKQTV